MAIKLIFVDEVIRSVHLCPSNWFIESKQNFILEKFGAFNPINSHGGKHFALWGF